MPLAVIRRGTALGLALLLAVAGTALADDLRADADTVDGIQSSVDLGAVDPGSHHSVDIAFVLQCKGTSHLTAGATYAVSEASRDVPTGGSLGVTAGSIVVPDAWPATDAFCTGDEGPASGTPATLSITAPTDPTPAGQDEAYSVEFALSDGGETGNMIVATVLLHVVVPADTTDPVLHGVPGDLTATTTTTSAIVTWPAPTATDDTDPSPTVGCTPDSGTAFPIGTTTVTCTATDARGNEASATFTVTVTKVSALTGTWGRPLADTIPALVGRAGRTIPLKLMVMAEGTPQGPGAISAPTLDVERLDACSADAAAIATSAGGPFSWSDGSWQLNLTTGGLGSGCVRLRASVDGAAVATAVVQLVPDELLTVKGRR